MFQYFMQNECRNQSKTAEINAETKAQRKFLRKEENIFLLRSVKVKVNLFAFQKV